MTQEQRRELATVARSAYWSEAEGQLVVAAWRASGETAVRFGEKHGLSARRLRWWERRLGKVATHEATIELVPIGVVERDDDRDAAIEVAVSEFTIRVRRGADKDTLRTVVEVLRSC